MKGREKCINETKGHSRGSKHQDHLDYNDIEVGVLTLVLFHTSSSHKMKEWEFLSTPYPCIESVSMKQGILDDYTYNPLCLWEDTHQNWHVNNIFNLRK